MGKLRANELHATRLLNRVLSAPDLVTTVQALPPERLSELVHEVGLEDAGELVALATTPQLEAMFDDDLWRSTDDAEERFDAARFVLWLEVLSEAGEAAVTKRLVELPREFLCFAVAELAYVVDMDALQEDVEIDDRYHERVERALELAAFEEWEEFRLVDRGLGGFDVLATCLLSLDTEYSEFLRAILERCRDISVTEIEERGGLVKALSRLEAAEEVARGARHERRTQRGYVSLADARSFVGLVIERLEYEGGRDPVTHAYFREVYGKQRAQADLEMTKPGRTPRRLVDVLGSELAQPDTSSAYTTLSAALSLLRERDVAVYELRVAELAYLANVLVTVSEPERRRLRPVEASEAALRVCAAGLDAFDVAKLGADELSVALEGLLLDTVFRAGWAPFVHGSARSTLQALLAEVEASYRRRSLASRG